MKTLLLIILCSFSLCVNAQIDTTILNEVFKLTEKVIYDCNETVDSLNREIKKLNRLDDEKSIVINKASNEIDKRTDVISEETIKAMKKNEKATKIEKIFIGGGAAFVGFFVAILIPD